MIIIVLLFAKKVNEILIKLVFERNHKFRENPHKGGLNFFSFYQND